MDSIPDSWWFENVVKSDVSYTSNAVVPDWKCLLWKALFREISSEGSSESSLTEKQYFPSLDYSSAKVFLPANEDEPQNFSSGSLETAYENNITTEFLKSVRNMNAEEVTDTLHKIVASNPAFRGNLHTHVHTHIYINIYIT